jgi:hypothetical protein
LETLKEPVAGLYDPANIQPPSQPTTVRLRPLMAKDSVYCEGAYPQVLTPSEMAMLNVAGSGGGAVGGTSVGEAQWVSYLAPL